MKEERCFVMLANDIFTAVINGIAKANYVGKNPKLESYDV